MTETFDWKGEGGDKFATMNPSDVEGTDAHFVDYFNVTVTSVFNDVCDVLAQKGLDKATAKVFDIGCSTGGKLAVLESLGFEAPNLYGVDVSPGAIKVLEKAHPNFNAKEVSSFEYGTCFDQVDTFDLVFHSAVMCQIPEDDYDGFFSGVKSLKPRFYMFMEGINLNGYEKVDNRLLHGHHHHQHQQHDGQHRHENYQHQMHSHHEHHHEHHVSDHHHHRHSSHKEPHQMHLGEVLDKGFHHTNNVEKVVKEKFPEAKQIFKKRLDYNESAAPMFKAVHFDFFLLSLYQIE